jgi:cobaltochelatase CobS
MTDITITGNARAALRSAITSHPKWSEYRKLSGKLVSEYSKEDYITACQALSLDIHAIIATTAETGKGDTMAKERTRDNYQVCQLRARFDAVSDVMTSPDREKAEGIFTSISRFGGGMATEAQFKAIEKLIDSAEKGVTSSAPVPVTSTVTAPSSAGTAMWEIIKDAARSDLDPMVRDLVGRALEGTQTVRIELTRQGETTGGTDGHQHPLFGMMCRALSARQANGYPVNVWLSGPTGSGKTYSVRQFAKAAGLEFGFHGTCREEHQLLGYVSPTTGIYQTTAFRNRWEHGGVILLDELDSYDAGATLALNGIADGFINFPDRMVTRHKDCYIVGAANTWGEGATASFVGRNRLDTAFMSRFPCKLAWTYDTPLEINISGNPDWAKRVQAARVRKDAAGLKHLIDPRHTMAGAALIAQGFTFDEAATLTYLAGLSAEQIKLVEGR